MSARYRLALRRYAITAWVIALFFDLDMMFLLELRQHLRSSFGEAIFALECLLFFVCFVLCFYLPKWLKVQRYCWAVEDAIWRQVKVQLPVLHLFDVTTLLVHLFLLFSGLWCSFVFGRVIYYLSIGITSTAIMKTAEGFWMLNLLRSDFLTVLFGSLICGGAVYVGTVSLMSRCLKRRLAVADKMEALDALHKLVTFWLWARRLNRAEEYSSRLIKAAERIDRAA